ncbi:uncharacterized protein LTHEOB_2790 [Neofusicoccum parvum]|uniref:Uncharacterized protein LTHEOB_2790 n=1 Tax=Neofusicoccum parvum TaxID=310453 RepID=A0ACB5SK19_9PEZI|nr:uncharacterized protein LTHEOB_2790 [Neofusicoccum parvum]
MAPQYTLEAINKLSEVEKMRFALAYLNHNDPKNVDWTAAATQSGSKSKESFKVMFNNTLKKLAASSDDSAGAAAAGGDGPASTPKKRKKIASAATDDAVNDDAELPKKRGRKKAMKKEPELDADIQAEINDVVAGVVKSQERSFFDDDDENDF